MTTALNTIKSFDLSGDYDMDEIETFILDLQDMIKEVEKSSEEQYVVIETDKMMYVVDEGSQYRFGGIMSASKFSKRIAVVYFAGLQNSEVVPYIDALRAELSNCLSAMA